MGLIINPAALVLVSMDVPEGTLAMRLVVAPVALVTCTILPDLLTLTVPVLTLPLARVPGPILEDVLWPVLNLALVVVLVRVERLCLTARCKLLVSPQMLSSLHYGGRRCQNWQTSSNSVSSGPRLHLDDYPDLTLQVLHLFL